METTIIIGKVAAFGTKKENMVELEVKLYYDKLDESRPVFSASVSVWNRLHTDIIWGGQCFEQVYRLVKRDLSREKVLLYKTILELWRKHHLNNMHAGTELQEIALEQFYEGVGITPGFESSVCYLKAINLYDDNGYKYGNSWLYRSIPKQDLCQIKQLFTNKPVR